jgi:transposase
MDDDTIRDWYKTYNNSGLKGLSSFDYDGCSSRMNKQQEEEFKAWLTETLPRSTNMIGEWLVNTYNMNYSRSGLVVLLHRLGYNYKKPKVISRKLDEERQKEFIDDYNKTLNNLDSNDVALFIDAVHPTHEVRPAGCWAPKEENIAVEQTSGRQRINIHGAINLETGQTQMIEADTINAKSTILLFIAILAAYPGKGLIHIFLDNARYHHAVMVREWLKQSGSRIVLHFLPPYCPHLNAIERAWGTMHHNVTHNRSYTTFSEFKASIMTFLTQTLPNQWDKFTSRITDNFRVISPKDFRVMA